jgi:hypothetical protein
VVTGGTKIPTVRSARAHRVPSDGVATALGIHLCLYCAVAGGLVFGLYALLQPARFPNPGIAAYEPLPGTVVTYMPPFRSRNSPALMGSAEPTPMPELEPTDLSTRQLEAAAFAQSTSPSELRPVPSKRSAKQTTRRNIGPENTKQRSACIPSYDSSGAQTGAC